MSRYGMSQPAYDIVNGWYEAVRGKGEEPPRDTFQIMVRGDLLYSYGTHFELARPLRNKRGKIHGYLLNGDTYSVTTSAHQSHVRHLLSDEETVIIPYEALNSAGIDLASVRIVHVKPDTTTTTHHRTTEIPEGARWRREEISEYRDPSDADYAAALVRATEDAKRSHEGRARRHRDDPKIWSDPGEFEPPTKNDLYLYSKRVVTGHVDKLHTSSRMYAPEITVTTLETGETEYTWTTTRHWLGESLIKARVTWTTQETCPECGGKGLHPMVGDGWDIRCRTCDRGWSRGTVTKNHHRWAYYLSGFDHEEARPLYFFAELPHGVKPETVAEAYETLKPDPVKMAEQMNRPIFRQGDIFGVPLDAMDRQQLKTLKARIVRRKVPPIPEGETSVKVTLPYVLNTNHTATEVAYLPGGVTLARGTMYHDPDGRRADHARRRIGDGKSWHVVIKNTVPLSVRR